MKTIAVLNPSEAMSLPPFLKSKGIQFYAKVQTEDTGLVSVELSADDEFFNRACEAAECWLETQYQRDAANSARACPSCRSIHLQFETDDTSAIVIRCADCNYSIAI